MNKSEVNVSGPVSQRNGYREKMPDSVIHHNDVDYVSSSPITRSVQSVFFILFSHSNINSPVFSLHLFNLTFWSFWSFWSNLQNFSIFSIKD